MANNYWDGSTDDGSWDTAANWSLGTVPVADENVFVTETDKPITAGLDQSAVALGIITFGPGFSGNIGDYNSGSPNYLKLNCAATKRISITGAPGSSSTQAMFIEYAGSATDIELVDYGTITAAGMVDKGLHLKRTSGTVAVVNYGGPLTLDTGTFNSVIDMGSAVTVASATTDITTYAIISQAAVATLNKMPTGTITITLGTLTVEASGTIVQVVQYGGTIAWNGGGAISSLLKVFGGVFDTSDATVQATIADVVAYQSSTPTFVDLTMASVTNNIEVHGKPGNPFIVYPAASLGTVA